MANITLDTTRSATRFLEYTAATRAQLLVEINDKHEGMASNIAFAQAQDGTWYAIFDRALKVVLTMDDVIGMNEDNENDPTIDVELEQMKLTMSA